MDFNCKQNIFIKKVITTNCMTLKLFRSYYFGPNIDFVTNLGSKKPRIGLIKMPKQALPAFTPSISGNATVLPRIQLSEYYSNSSAKSH